MNIDYIIIATFWHNGKAKVVKFMLRVTNVNETSHTGFERATSLSAQYLVDQRSISDLRCKYLMRLFPSVRLEKVLVQPDGITLILMQI